MSTPIDDDELFKNSIKYLYNLSTTSAMNVPALESILTTKRRLMEGRTATFLPQYVAKMNQKCQRCLLNFSDGPADYRIKSRMKRYKFAKKISAKLNSDSSSLTKYQKRYLKRMSNFNGNQLVTTCKFCKKEHFIKMALPKTQKKIKVSVIPSKKKKNKRDKFSGLNQEAVLSSTPQNDRNLDSSEMNSEDKNNTRTKMKISKNNKKPLEASVTIEDNSKENTNKKNEKKKSQNLNRLSEFLNSTTKKTKSPSASLKNFLQCL